MGIEEQVNTPAFKAILSGTEHLGPFHSNPKICKMYRTVRILGYSEKQTKELLNNELSRRNLLNIK